MFDIAPNPMNLDLCNAIIAELNNENIEDSLIIDEQKKSSKVATIRRSRSCLLQPTHWVAQELIRSALGSEFFLLKNLLCQCVQFTVYDQDGLYDWHTDRYSEPLKEDCPTEWIGLNRIVSVSVNITDPNDYDGGDLQFRLGSTVVPNESGRHRLRKQGTIILFSSDTAHRVTPVARGTRYSLVSWFLG